MMFDFQCDTCSIVFERYVDSSITHHECPCGHDAKRLISMPTVKLEGITGDFPGAHDKWARLREDNARIKAKKNS